MSCIKKPQIRHQFGNGGPQRAQTNKKFTLYHVHSTECCLFFTNPKTPNNCLVTRSLDNKTEQKYPNNCLVTLTFENVQLLTGNQRTQQIIRQLTRVKQLVAKRSLLQHLTKNSLSKMAKATKKRPRKGDSSPSSSSSESESSSEEEQPKRKFVYRKDDSKSASSTKRYETLPDGLKFHLERNIRTGDHIVTITSIRPNENNTPIRQSSMVC
jgi:hypothetical protein